MVTVFTGNRWASWVRIQWPCASSRDGFNLKMLINVRTANGFKKNHETNNICCFSFSTAPASSPSLLSRIDVVVL
jgi:hypothetical protein